ncbi:hypothetical protein B0H10DRAFT_1937591 [Mycena sp. CBHHK59/15]|nr:hypothetical protein B0H10DRAFT_1937591 [Mycena sp. CBHHK59/15]
MAPAERPCKHCGQNYNTRGITRHEKACGEEKSNKELTRNLAKQIRQRENETLLKEVLQDKDSQAQATNRGTIHQNPVAGGSGNWEQLEFLDNREDRDFSNSPEPGASMEHETLPANQPREPQLHDIKHEFHPHSKRPVVVQSFDDYRTSESLPYRGPPTD